MAGTGITPTTLSYDPLGRLWRLVSPAKTIDWLYDGDAMVTEYGAQPHRYVHGNGDDDPLIWYNGAGLTDRRSLQADASGSIVSVADAGGAALALDSYDEYGIWAASHYGRFGFTGQMVIAQIGMYYYKARMYSPTLGRFLQTDPIGYADQNNLYAYVYNDPLNNEDPDGKCGPLCGAIIGGLEDVAFQVIIEGKNIDQIDLGDVAISAAAGATGVGLVTNTRRFFKAERAAARAERIIERASNSAQRAGGSARLQRTAAQMRRGQAALAASGRSAEKAVAATVAVTAVKEGTKKATPPVTVNFTNPKDDRKKHPLNP